ncbi:MULTISPECIES: mycothione reductase [unclassified Corynebacterium]|uniref:mycothione reductase n=1 Tax=unclassified Corynebacterium TaxID=2624378 RepID=UPI00216A16FA|nr:MULTISPECIES: mycothione reductase [unclassified Corynebacterium]MCS4490920.1 mycothione reductase [Corynebacterium sp. ES2715-CONJ3]MCS4531198.1 mycothione reductase [Corynebacterium sp. ES2730-CONJ]
MKTAHFDLIVIGAGSGNMIPGEDFRDKSIAIVEKGAFGGTCLNVGCIPTKMFVYASEVAGMIAESEKYGIASERGEIDWNSIQKRVFEERIDPISAGGEEYRRGPQTPNIEVFDQHARFTGPRTIRTAQGAEEWEITAEDIVIAAGARPRIPEVVRDIDFFTNENIMRIERLPETMAVWGGGFIALEFAHIFHQLGVKVTIINRSDLLLRRLDADIAERITTLTAQQMDTHVGVEIVKAEQSKETGAVDLVLDNGHTVHADMLLVATGRIPNGDLMDLEKAGIELDAGRIKVDDFGRTTAEGVWALGDISSPFQLKHVANAESRAISHNLLHPHDLVPMPHDNVPFAIFTHPQIASIGLTEAAARQQGHELTVKIQDYKDVAYGWAMEDTTGFVKLIADRDSEKLLGAHIVGPQASTLIQPLITAMSYDLNIKEFARKQYWIHPALPEVVENALLGLEFASA